MCYDCGNNLTPCCPFEERRRRYSPYIPDFCWRWRMDTDYYYPPDDTE